MTTTTTTDRLAEVLVGEAVWAVSIADHTAEHLTPRQIERLCAAGNAMREAADLLQSLSTDLANAEASAAKLEEALETASGWADEERRWAETRDLGKWIERCEALEAALNPGKERGK